LLKVLSKSELDGAIMLDELLQIMENFGLYDQDADNAEEQDDDDDAEEATENSPPDN